MNGVRDSVTTGGGREAAAELVASEEDIVMRVDVDLDTKYIDQALRLEVRAHNLFKLATSVRQSRLKSPCLSGG